MPTYQYACDDCGRPFEKRLRMAQASQKQSCPECGSGHTRKRISTVAIGGNFAFAESTAAPPTGSPFS
jgi:putative FmdB family regulatory protein